MTALPDWLAEQWFANATSVVAFTVSVLAYRGSRPRITVAAKRCIEVDDDDALTPARAAIQLTVTNDGGSPAIVRRVYLEAVSGGFSAYPSSSTRGPDLSKGPVEVAAHGGFELWSFDYHEMRGEAELEVRDEPMVLRAAVVVGSRTVRAKSHVTLTADETRHQPRRVRIRQWIRSLRHSRVQMEMGIPLDGVDLVKGTAILRVKNFGNGIARHVRVEMVASRRDGPERRIETFETRRLWFILPHRSRAVEVPIDPPPTEVGEEVWVRARSGRNGAWSATSAPVRTVLEPHVREFQERRNIST